MLIVKEFMSNPFTKSNFCVWMKGLGEKLEEMVLN